MSSSRSDLAVVIGAGAWHTPPLYAEFTRVLNGLGIECEAPLMPTLTVIDHDVTDDTNPIFDSIEDPTKPWPTLSDDANVIEESIVRFSSQGKKVVVLGHSMGGFTASQASKPELSFKRRSQQGLRGGIVGIFYVAAFLLPVGLAVHDVVGEENVPPYSKVHVSIKR